MEGVKLCLSCRLNTFHVTKIGRKVRGEGWSGVGSCRRRNDDGETEGKGGRKEGEKEEPGKKSVSSLV
jgi:hypothetical protein